MIVTFAKKYGYYNAGDGAYYDDADPIVAELLADSIVTVTQPAEQPAEQQAQ
jgi:hypothetical protein